MPSHVMQNLALRLRVLRQSPTLIRPFLPWIRGEVCAEYAEEYERYCKSYSVWSSLVRSVVICLLPAGLSIALISLPLADPYIGWKENYMFFIAYMMLMLGPISTGLLMASMLSSEMTMTKTQTFCLVVVVIASGIAVLLLIAILFEFPVPCATIITTCVCIPTFLRTFYIFKGRDMQRHPEISNLLRQWTKLALTFGLQIVIYPAFALAFALTTNIWLQDVIFGIMTMAKFFFKASYRNCYFNNDEKIQQISVIFGNTFHALFIAVFLQNTISLTTICVFLALKGAATMCYILILSIYYPRNRAKKVIKIKTINVTSIFPQDQATSSSSFACEEKKQQSRLLYFTQSILFAELVEFTIPFIFGIFCFFVCRDTERGMYMVGFRDTELCNDVKLYSKLWILGLYAIIGFGSFIILALFVKFVYQTSPFYQVSFVLDQCKYAYINGVFTCIAITTVLTWEHSGYSILWNGRT